MNHLATDNIHWREVARPTRRPPLKETDEQVMRRMVNAIGTKRITLNDLHRASQVSRPRMREMLLRLSIAGLVKVSHTGDEPMLKGSFRLAPAGGMCYLTGPVEGMVMP